MNIFYIASVAGRVWRFFLFVFWLYFNVEDVFLCEYDVKELLEMKRGLNLLRNDCFYGLPMSSMAGFGILSFSFFLCFSLLC